MVKATSVPLRDRIGYDAGATRAEDALAWAAQHGFRYLDLNADIGPNRLDSWSDKRIRDVRAACDRDGVQIGLHTLSGVNVGEFSPFVSDAVDQYMRAYVDLASGLKCEWVIVHAGFHFSNEVEARRKSSLDRLRRMADYAGGKRVKLILENLNREPDKAEVHYMGFNVEECRAYFDAIQSPHFGWAFTVNHSHLVPEGIGGFIDAFGVSRIGEVRLADNTGDYEVHMNPGEGTIDFAAVFKMLEGAGYKGHYSMAFGTPDDKLRARDLFARYG